MAISSYSQNIYPKKLVINNDTIAAFSCAEVRDINCMISERQVYKDQLDTAIVYIGNEEQKYKLLLKDKNLITALQKESLALCKGENDLKDIKLLTLQGELVIQKNKHKRTIWTIIIVALTLSLLK